MNGDCEYVRDGRDTDGTIWYRCTTHDELAPSKDAPCAGYEEIPYAYRELERKLNPARFSHMSGKLAALLSFVLGTEKWTSEPRIIEVAIDGSGNIIVGHAPGPRASTGDWFGGTADELDRNLRRLFRVAELTAEEKRLFAQLRRQRITDWRRKAVSA